MTPAFRHTFFLKNLMDKLLTLEGFKMYIKDKKRMSMHSNMAYQHQKWLLIEVHKNVGCNMYLVSKAWRSISLYKKRGLKTYLRGPTGRMGSGGAPVIIYN